MSGHNPMAASRKHDNKSYGSIKCAEFLDQVNDYQPFKKDSTPWN
jgi:hypothetical protein